MLSLYLYEGNYKQSTYKYTLGGKTYLYRQEYDKGEYFLFNTDYQLLAQGREGIKLLNNYHQQNISITYEKVKSGDKEEK
jgi:hypothetical protein